MAVGLTLGSGEANPKLALGLIFAVLAVFFVVLFALQRSDLDRVAGADARGSSRAAAEGGRRIENPTTMDEPDLWAAMAVGPINAEAVRARAAMWEAGRRSLRLGMLIVLLIFLTVPSMYLLESFVPLLIGGPLIAIAAIWGGIRALAPGGELDTGYANVGTAMAPLGLEVTERPTVSIEMREPVTPRMGPRVHVALVLSGERNGRRVSIRSGARRGPTPARSPSAPPPTSSAQDRDGRGRPRGHSRRPPGRCPVRLALRPLARRAARRRQRVKMDRASRLRGEVPGRVRRFWLGSGSPAAPAASA